MPARPDLLRVLHDPLQYYAPWHQAGAKLQPAQRSALNAVLVQRFALPAYQRPPPHQQLLTERLVAGWSRLPGAAYLVACAKHRHRLMGSRAFVGLPRPVHAFLRLPFATCGPTAVDVEDADSLRAWGAAYLLAGLQEQMPPWLRARAQLCLAGPAQSAPARGSAEFAGPFDITCFWSAWHHAANVS